MPKETPNLNLYKIDPETDGEMSFNVETMLNENWDKVDEGFQELKENLTAQRTDYVRQPAYAVTGGTGNAYTVSTTPAPTAYVDGMGVIIRANRANTGAATLNWNGLGAIPIVDAKGRALIADKIPNGARLSLRYSSAAVNFQLQGEGGEYGTATPAEVIQGYTLGTEEGVVTGTLALSGNATAGDVVSGQTFYSTNPKSKITGTLTLSGNAAAGDVIAGQTFYNTNPKIKATGTLALSGDAATANVLTGKTFYTTNPKTKLTGAMPNRGSVTNTITTQGGQYTIPAGYHSGSGKVTASFANLVAGNVRQGVNIGGVVGNYQSFLRNSITPLYINGVFFSDYLISESVNLLSNRLEFPSDGYGRIYFNKPLKRSEGTRKLIVVHCRTAQYDKSTIVLSETLQGPPVQEGSFPRVSSSPEQTVCFSTVDYSPLASDVFVSIRQGGRSVLFVNSIYVIESADAILSMSLR